MSYIPLLVFLNSTPFICGSSIPVHTIIKAINHFHLDKQRVKKARDEKGRKNEYAILFSERNDLRRVKTKKAECECRSHSQTKGIITKTNWTNKWSEKQKQIAEKQKRETSLSLCFSFCLTGVY